MSVNVDPIYALLSAMSYEAGRQAENLLNGLLVPGVAYVTDPDLKHFEDKASGFEASTFTYDGKIVISFAGTLPGSRISKRTGSSASDSLRGS